MHTPELDCLTCNMEAAVRNGTDTHTGGGIFTPAEVRKALAELEHLRELADLMAHIVNGEPGKTPQEYDYADLITNTIDKARALMLKP